jgi:AAA domain (dynein-related subfamily)
MNAKDLIESLDYMFKAELTPFIWGRAGIGKSSIVKKYAEDKGYHFFPFYLGTQSDLGDVLGLAEFVDNGDGSKSTAFAMPKWLKETITYCEENPDSGAVIFLDEFNRARRDILSGMFSLALDKTFHTLKLPKNCHIIAAGNPPTDEYFTTDINETALMARFVHIKLEPTFQEWAEYAKKTELESTLIEWLKAQPDLLEEKHTEFDLKKMVKPDRRAISRLDKLFKLKTPQHLLEQLMHGIIGLERTVSYLQYLNEQDKPLSASEILKGKRQSLLEKWSNPEDIMASLLNLSVDALKEEIKSRNESKKNFSDKEKENLWFFLKTCPKDISYTFLSSQIPLHNNPAFKEFTLDDKYADLLIDLSKSVQGKKKE